MFGEGTLGSQMGCHMKGLNVKKHERKNCRIEKNVEERQRRGSKSLLLVKTQVASPTIYGGGVCIAPCVCRVLFFPLYPALLFNRIEKAFSGSFFTGAWQWYFRLLTSSWQTSRRNIFLWRPLLLPVTCIRTLRSSRSFAPLWSDRVRKYTLLFKEPLSEFEELLTLIETMHEYVYKKRADNTNSISKIWNILEKLINIQIF